MKAGSRCWWFLTVLACALISPLAPGATTFHVGGDGADALATIQEAVDAAADGDTIIINPGTYSGRGNCDVDLRGKALTIWSTDPLDPDIVARTIIDCAGSPTEPHRGFYIVDSNGVVLAGLTITRGLALSGGAIYCQNSTLDLMNCRILDNATLPGDSETPDGGPGGGLYCEGSIVKIVGCTIRGNTAGDGVSSEEGRAGAGGDGGGLCSVKSDLQVAVSTISYNAAGAGGSGPQSGRSGRGGGLYADAATLDRCIIEANRASEGGGVFSSVLEISNSLVAGNQAGQGGGLWCDAGVVHLCTVAGNVVSRSRADANDLAAPAGAGIFCTPDVAVQNSILSDNTPDQIAGHDYRKVVYSNIKYATEDDSAVENPLFVRSGRWVHAKDSSLVLAPDDPNAVWVSGNYRLRVNSPLLDAGDPNYIPLEVEKDLDGNARRADVAVDLGAYESAALVPVYRFWSASLGRHFYTASAGEKDKVIAQYAHVWTFEGPAYQAYTRPMEPNLLPVYRFWSGSLQSHFYTINEGEKDKVLREHADVWTFEGTAFYAWPQGQQPAETKPVHRFWSDTLGSHFFTISEGEKDKLIRESAEVWSYEGIAWYTYSMPDAEPSQSGTASAYEFSGESEETLCTLSLKAYVDGREAKIDAPEMAYVLDNAYMRMAVDLEGMNVTLNEILMESAILPHTVTIETGEAGVPVVLSTGVMFWGRTSRGPFDIDPQTLAFPTTAGDRLAGDNESFTIGGSATVDGAKLDVGLVQRATQFAAGAPGTFDTAALPESLSARLAGTFQWSYDQGEELLLETTVKGQVLQLYVTSVRLQTTGLWQGRPAR
jgi:hypothetical protein